MSISNRRCQQCGTTLAPNEVFCNNCGTLYTDPDNLEPTQFSSSYSGTPNQSTIEPTQYAEPASPYGKSPYGSPSTSYGSSGYAPPPPNVPYGASSNIPYGASDVYGQQQFGAPFPQASRPKKSPVLLIGIIILLLLVIGGGFFLLAKPSGSSNSTTVVNGATSTPLAAALFSDNFANNSKGWILGNGTGFSRSISNNTLILAENNQGRLLPEGLPATPNFSDFTVTVTFTLQQGDQSDSAGIYMRGDSSKLDHDYRVDINGNNTYAIAREFLDSSNTQTEEFLVKATPSPAIKPLGQPNTITVIMKGSKLVLLINNTPITSVSDTNYTSGQIALYAAHGDTSTSNGTKAAFSNIAVYPAPSQLP